MNDFTKAELKFIAIALERFAVKDSELDKKIHSLIDNHCEHQWAVYAVGNPMAYERPGEVKCSKCGARPNVNQ